jgi:hypothetical protein
MFKIEPNPTFKADVAITTPAGEASLTLEFKHQGKKALKAWIERASAQTDLEGLATVIAGWEGVADSAGNPLLFDPAHFATLLDAYPTSATEIFNAYLKVLTESRVKN